MTHPNFLKLLFIRHAESTGNQEKRMQGQGDYTLSELGLQQAAKLARSLLAEGWIPTHIYSSPLKRAAQTAQILLDYFQMAPLPAPVSDLIDGSAMATVEEIIHPLQPVSIHYADDLREFQNGIFQGLTWGEAMAQYPDLCRSLEASPDWIPIPQAETLSEARQRASQFIQHLLQQHQNGDHVWVVTHSWILQHLIAALLGSDRSWRLRANNTALFEFWLDHSRWYHGGENQFNTDLWQVRRINDYHHLQL